MSRPTEYRANEAAERLDVSPSRIYQLLDQGLLTRGPKGGITATSVQTYAQSRRGPGRPRRTK